MWTRRKIFPTLDAAATPHPATVATPLYGQQQSSGSSDFTLDEGAYNFVASLGYTLVPALSPQEAAELLTWALPMRWVDKATPSASSSSSNADMAARLKVVMSALLQNKLVLEACSQVEYFLFGTDNGQVFLLPLLPPHLLDALLRDVGEEALPGLAEAYRREAQRIRSAADHDAARHNSTITPRLPVNCVGRRLLHRHVREEPVTALDHLGVLVASATSSVDNAVALSCFHPRPVGVVCIPHPCPPRSLKLWEGGVFTQEVTHESNKTEASTLRRQWREGVQEAEPAAVYLFTGDDAGLVRLWRVDVVARTYALQHVLVCSGCLLGMLSPLTPFAREDTTRRVPARESDCVVHCLEIDVASNRLFGGTEGGAYVWALDALPWRGPDAEAVPNKDSPCATTAARTTSASCAVRHPFCWDEALRMPLSCALRCWEAAQPAASPPAPHDSEAVVAYRASRLVNHHVWVVDAPVVQAEMARAQHHTVAGEKVSGWKPKYGRVLTNGATVGVVSNDVRLADVPDGSVATRLTATVVTVTFDNGEVKNDLHVPLSCVVPVLYPVALLRTPGTACFALRVLAPQRRILTSCADGKVCVWTCKPADEDAACGAAETYVPQLVTENRQTHRGLGRQLCVLRTPDVFVSSSFDDGLVKEWHVYDEPELLLRCARRFTLTPFVSDGSNGHGAGVGNAKEVADMFKSIAQSGAEAAKKKPKAAGQSGNSSNSDDDEDANKATDEGDAVAGICCAAAYPAFGALFLVGAFESAIQAYSLTEVVGCEPPRNFIYNGHKTVHLPASMAEDVYHAL